MLLSSSNTFSHGLRKMKLKEYIKYTISANSAASSVDSGAQPEHTKSNESFYLFGNNYGGLWDDIKHSYLIPPCQHCDVCGARTVGIGGALSGVSFHYHGPGFSEVLLGEKRWFLFPPPGYVKRGDGRSDSVSVNGDTSKILNEHCADVDSTCSRHKGSSAATQMMETKRYFDRFDPNMTVDKWVVEQYPLYRVNLVPSFSSSSSDRRLESSAPSAVTPTTLVSEDNHRKGYCDKNETRASIDAAIDNISDSDRDRDRDSIDPIEDIDGSEGYLEGLLECVTGPGEMLYFPSNWMHATLNVQEYNVFMSLFLDFQLIPKNKDNDSNNSGKKIRESKESKRV